MPRLQISELRPGAWPSECSVLKAVEHEEEESGIVKNYDEKGKIVEVEILNASKLLGGFLTEILKAPERKIVEIV